MGENAGALRAVDDAARVSALLLRDALLGAVAALEAEYQVLVDELNGFLRELRARLGELTATRDALVAALAEIRAADPAATDDDATTASRARATADESRRAADQALQEAPVPAEASDDLRRLYRQVALAVHPDLGTSVEDRERRTRLMAAASEAFATRNATALRRILEAADDTGGGTRVRVDALAEQIEALRARQRELGELIAELRQSDLAVTRGLFAAEVDDGVDPWATREKHLRREIRQLTNTLAEQAAPR